MKWAFDIDGVILDFVTPFLENINKATSKNYERKDLIEFDAERVMDVPKEVIERCIDKTLKSHLFPYPGVVDFMKRTQTVEPITFVTCRKQRYKDVTIDTLMHHLSPMRVSVTFVDKKGHALDALGVKFFVEDNIEFAAEIVDRSDTLVLLIDREWNRDESVLKGVKNRRFVRRIKDWTELLEIYEVIESSGM